MPVALQCKVQRQWLFAVPLYRVEVADTEEVNRRIEREFHASRERHWYTHKVNGRYENTMASLVDVPSVAGVLDLAERLAVEVAGRPLFISREGRQPGYWFNLTETRGGTTSVHNHGPGPVLSGVYYVKVPPNSGNLVFTRSRSYVRDHVSGELEPEGGHFLDVEVAPQEGLMVLFPAWLDHAVTPNDAGAERMALAFNLSVLGSEPMDLKVAAVING